MRLITRIDFDGLVCAVFLVEKGIVDDYKFVHPREIQEGKVEINSNDVLANVPYNLNCGLWFDHHSSETERLEIKELNYKGDSRSALSAAQVIWDYYGGEKTFGKHFLPILEAVNKADSADLTLFEILDAEDWILLSFIMDPGTGLWRFDDFQIDHQQFMLEMINYCRTMTIDEILRISDVEERAERYYEQQIHYKNMLIRCTRIERNVVVTNLLSEDTIYCGNRFIVFASHPDQNIEIRLTWDATKQNVIFGCGHSILKRTSRTNVGQLMYKYGGGGHEQVGSCSVPAEKWESVFEEIIEKLQKDG